jgi:hypothetical protein
LLKFPQPQEPEEFETPFEEVIDMAYQYRKSIKNIVILIQLEDGNFKAMPAVDPDVDMWMFVDIVKQRAMLAAYTHLTGAEGDLTPA